MIALSGRGPLICHKRPVGAGPLWLHRPAGGSAAQFPTPTHVQRIKVSLMPSTLRTPDGRTVPKVVCALAVALLAGCSQFSIPFTHSAQPDTGPARASADNMVRLDAAMRSGCESVQNIEKPSDAQASPNGDGTQRWVARTCTGDIAYDVVTTAGPDGPIVKVLPVAGPLNNPMNPNFKPAMPGQ